MHSVDQTINLGRGLLFGDLGQLGITRGGGGAGVPEQALNMTQAQALFEQMGGIGVTQGVDRDFFLIPHCATTNCGDGGEN